ncbi:4-(cytidine 5'-diphospho)-2-C-methyl-D-erythritol kinase [Rhizobiaceae bacterium n13]|uniref:4-diphosphocytidyl-2-C-methyl-D-erythritol kinase n=1 Tax=Ferirhizobium litorale TaxID=2927786 RepID=A0AAE3QEA6_9HYPH|nr:4-(cytidine 5'-diphospho)-2-C-methyl-D-erythritol kinase [Fererhizobium litorale]MDI7861503.1 4-(cytidine 5'-diphospho)-2-C-methyl-D-erythritol kinase [Fererhizobium litorale]MDI7921649.1 4-(cytidine 5'-diphospho)-2-C-methyl-D-erythritol kinase [Fererhizobium litorale]
MSMISECAPAKINLALHVTGRRADGYHLLESLVTFTDTGDQLSFSPASTDGFSVSGRFAGNVPREGNAGGDNLVVKARDMLRSVLAGAGLAAPPVHIHLEKNLPVASGIGGGSADAAATLRGVMRLWEIPAGAVDLPTLALRLGADVPMCLAGTPLIARGIGEAIEPLRGLPSFAMVLANPLQPVSTPDVFQALESKANAPLSLPGELIEAAAWIAAIGNLRNDLEAPASRLVAEIAVISGLLAGQGATLVRMSGSGATCFGIFSDSAQAKAAEAALLSIRPDWYFQATTTISGAQACRA